MRQIKIIFAVGIYILTAINAFAQHNHKLVETFNKDTTQFEIIGRGSCVTEDGLLKSIDAYAGFGSEKWKNYQVEFKARVSESAEEVQIWSGFRALSRDNRYVLGFRGGNQNNLILLRLGYMGTDELLALRALDFHPEPGIWYEFKIEVTGSRIRVFLNNEKLPRIDVADANSSLAPRGKITLGGAWIENEFDNLTVTQLNEDYLSDVPVKEYSVEITQQDKEKKRKSERAAYKEVVVKDLNETRSEISLNGDWLFMPQYELSEPSAAYASQSDDQDWHVMSVPNFWNPSRIWLHGETFESFPKGTSDAHFQMETARCEAYTFDYEKTRTAWYRQWINLPENVEGKHMVLQFDAVSKAAEVYINGERAGSNVGMFGEFRIDGSQLFKPGKNLVAVKVVRDYITEIEDADKIVDVAVSVPVTNKMLRDIPHGFYRGDPAGIWQPVSLVITGPVKIEDVFIKPGLSGAGFEITVKNHSSKKVRFDVSTEITGQTIADKLYKGIPVKKVALEAGEERVISYSISGLKPRLWSPQSPYLYDFTFRLTNKNGTIDNRTIHSGFRTFEAKDGEFYLNGNPYWLRGANQTPFALAPNDVDLADTFFQLMNTGNMEVTRTHTTPFNKLWMKAADRNGVGISFEGTWPWLMIHHSMPEQELIDLWADEFYRLIKKYRNHPSLLFWTVNNEMKFYDNEPDFEKAKQKMRIISDVVKKMREIDPTRPISFDSNYRRNEKKFSKEFFNEIDDGDIDDVHAYYNWYNHTIFDQFNGEFQQNYLNPGRPLISQEMSTGYPNNDTGHATRFYTLVHQNPQSLIGDQAYAFADPSIFLEVQSFTTGELAEALRRSNDKADGFLHFALVTWFKDVYDAENIEPYSTYYAMKRALQPVLVSAELWGRHFYAGEKLPARICVVNDKEDGSDLSPTKLTWSLITASGEVVSSGAESIPTVKHSEREWISPRIMIPENLPHGKTELMLRLQLTEKGVVVSENEYKIVGATEQWSKSEIDPTKKLALVDFNNLADVFEALNIKYDEASGITQALSTKADLYIFSGLDHTNNTRQEVSLLRSFVAEGGKILLLNSPGFSKKLFPDHITGWIEPTEGDIVNMEIPESTVFDGIDLLELRYFNNNKRELPTVCHQAMKINRNANIEGLASHMKIHGYISGTMAERTQYVEKIKGFPIVKIKEKGMALVSTMAHEKGVSDPIAGRLLVNMINYLLGY